MTRVPFVDVTAGLRPYREAILAAFAEILDAGHYVGGPPVARFEQAFAARCQAAHAVAVRTGTDALLLSFRALGIGAGDEVITAPNSFFASAEAIALAGATPVFADVDDETLLLDPDQVAKKIGPRTRAIVPVHLYGQVCDMERLAGFGVPLVEDACQAHGATRGGRVAGSIGVAGCFSFYPTKNLGALGEGGCVVTSDSELAAKLRMLRDHGQSEKHRHEVIGYNARLDSLQCAALAIKLAGLDAAIAARRALAARYRERLNGIARLVTERAGGEAVYHLLVARVRDRDRVRARLAAAGIDSAIHYPTPIHLQPAFAHLGHRPGDFPVTERACAEILSLPMYPELAPEAVDFVCAALVG